MKTYTTIQGDTWDIIALKTMGSEFLMDKLIEANTEQAETFLFSAGIGLKIPDVVSSESVSEKLPPWKGGK